MIYVVSIPLSLLLQKLILLLSIITSSLFLSRCFLIDLINAHFANTINHPIHLIPPQKFNDFGQYVYLRN